MEQHEPKHHHQDSTTTTTTILAALSTIPPPQLSHLINTLSTTLRRHHHRLSTILSSPSLFSHTLHRLHSLSLHHKCLLLSRHLLSSLHLLTHFLNPKPPPPPPSTMATLRDLDSALLLLLLCEVRRHQPHTLDSPLSHWRVTLTRYFTSSMTSLSGITVSNTEVLLQCVEHTSRCWAFVCGGGREVATSASAAVALPSVEVVAGAGVECVICKEVMREGRDVCQLPCDHRFHWSCILPWLRTRNTCPCCRFRLPSDDVYGEIERLWGVLVRTSGIGDDQM